MASSKLLLAAKSLSVDPGAANAKNLLAVAARCEERRLHFVASCSRFHSILCHFYKRLVINSNVIIPEVLKPSKPSWARKRCHVLLLNKRFTF